MKFSLTISDATEAEISAFFSRSPLASTAIITGNNMPSTTVADDDESGETNNNAPGVDSAGIPWDERIHSKNKGLNSDGTWRKKRNVDANTVNAVEAELRGGGQQQQQMTMPQQTMQMPTPPQQTPMHMPQHMMQPAPAQPMQHQQPMQMPQMQHQAPMPHQPQQTMQMPSQQLDFNGFMVHLTQKMQQKDATGAAIVDANYLVGVIQRLNAMMQTQFNVITDIVGNQMAINNAIAIINADGRW